MMVMPSDNIISCGWGGAKKSKNGPSFMAAVSITEALIPLGYPDAKKVKSLDELYELKKYVDKRLVTQNKAKILRTRPIFRQWSLEFDVTVDTNLFSLDAFHEAMYNAGTLVGLGDFCPRQSHPGSYGKFEIEVIGDER
jgi:hypothetical protein